MNHVSNYWICYLGKDDVYLLLNARLLKNIATKGQYLPRLYVEDEVNRT